MQGTRGGSNLSPGLHQPWLLTESSGHRVVRNPVLKSGRGWLSSPNCSWETVTLCLCPVLRSCQCLCLSSSPVQWGTWVGRGQLRPHGVCSRYSIIPSSVRCSTKDYGVSDVSVADPGLGTGDYPCHRPEFCSGSLSPTPHPPVTSDILEVVHGVQDEPQPVPYFFASIRSTFVSPHSFSS